jgi:hypothetical protein
MCIEDLKGVKIKHEIRTEFSKVKFFLITLFTPKLLLFFWKARKPGIEADKVKVLNVLSKTFEKAMNEVMTVYKDG